MIAKARPAALPAALVSAISGGDYPLRLRLCAAVSEALWAYGFKACGTDTERGDWVVAHADWLNYQLDEPWRGRSAPQGSGDNAGALLRAGR